MTDHNRYRLPRTGAVAALPFADSADEAARRTDSTAIAAALGCNVGAINVARARLGLKPRWIVSGRPKQEPDEPAHKIERVALTTSRLMEFCTQNELVSSDWPRVLRVVALHHPSPPMAPKRPSMSSARGRHR
jgi:hypothetical protein